MTTVTNGEVLKGRVALISGAAGRLGADFARAILAESGKVCLVDISERGKILFKSEIEAGNACFVQADTTVSEEIDLAITHCNDQFGKLDAAVHCAYPVSSQWGTRFEDIRSDLLSQDLSSQLGGAIIFSQSLIRTFREQGGGHLVHIASIHGIAAPKFWHYKGTTIASPIEYSAIKSGVIAITRYLAKYCKDEGIQVNCISPGGIKDDQPTEFLDRYRQSCNTKGMLESQDVAGALIFLLSKQSRFITGQNIVVDDGWSL